MTCKLIGMLQRVFMKECKHSGWYIVQAGTNVLQTHQTGDKRVVIICETQEIAQNIIDENGAYREKYHLEPYTKSMPISIVEYQKLYSQAGGYA